VWCILEYVNGVLINVYLIESGFDAFDQENVIDQFQLKVCG
jgi:hypothetical protein